jgi:hypothetical protein
MFFPERYEAMSLTYSEARTIPRQASMIIDTPSAYRNPSRRIRSEGLRTRN